MTLRPPPLLLAACVGLLTLALVDRGVRSGTVSVDGILDGPFLRNFSPYEADERSRLGHKASEIVIGGLGASAPVSVVLVLGAKSEPHRVGVYANGTLVGEEDLDASFRAVFLRAFSDDLGEVRIRLVAEGERKRGIYRLRALEVREEGVGWIPRRRWLEYALFVALSALLAGLGFETTRARVSTLAVATGSLCAALVLGRLYPPAYLPFVLALLASGAAASALVTLKFKMPPPSARFVVLGFLCRLGFVLQPTFPSIDAEFHTHNVWRFHANRVVSSRAPGPSVREALPVPYPPALYAILSPFVARGEENDFPVRLTMGFLEATAPLLLFVLMRTAGSSPRAAGAASAAAAVMPEGILVLGKGIAANIAGAWSTLLLVIALVSDASFVVLVALFTLTFLTHLGASLCLALLVALFLGWGALRGNVRPSQARRILAAVALGAALAWVLYYREVLSLVAATLESLGGHLYHAPGEFFRIRWVRIGKTGQDLLLKFGGVSLLLAGVGLSSKVAPTRLERLLGSWLFSGILLGGLAVLTPIPLRFEYFLVPPVSMAAGLGAEVLEGKGRGLLVMLSWTLLLVIQVALGLLLLFQRFNIISVIQESDRWPPPFVL